jgi:S1/P1 Nuclease
MVVARIAQFRLEDSTLGKEAFSWANSLLAPLTYYCGEDKYPFVECSVWPDKLKIQGWTSFNNWHYKDEGIIHEGFTPKEKFVDANQNAVWAIN